MTDTAGLPEQDEKIVEIMARGLYEHDKHYTPAWNDQLALVTDYYCWKARAALAALRAANMEVVQWRPLLKSDIPLPIDVETMCFPFGECRYEKITHWTIFKGPNHD